MNYFSPMHQLCINCYKNGLGYLLGDFFTNSSGHPDGDQMSYRKNNAQPLLHYFNREKSSPKLLATSVIFKKNP
jgi:hypothetical protein